MIGYVLLALVIGWVLRVVMAKRARASFCVGAECVNLALRLQPKTRGTGWKHGFARVFGTTLEWRGEYRVRPGADLTLDLTSLRIAEHRPVKKGEAMLGDHCELLVGTYRGEPVQLAVPQTELPMLLGWIGTSPPV